MGIYIKHRLYREHTTQSKQGIIKYFLFTRDLNNLGRDLLKTIIIDNIPENFINNFLNGLDVRTWVDDFNDTFLYDLLKILRDLYLLKVQDVRYIIKEIKTLTTNRIKRNMTNYYSSIDITKFL